MTLKELRISKGLTQVECANYLQMTVRNYQNYENNLSKINTVRYNDIYRKIELYGTYNVLHEDIKFEYNSFNTNVIIGEGLKSLHNVVKGYKKRDCFNILNKYINENFDGKICILYGLRRTGKTTMIFQMIGELPIEKTAYIKVKSDDHMSLLSKDLDKLYGLGYKYIFIDEITLLEDFINTAAVLSDIFSMLGMKIVISGTDSLGFAMANRDELYDRSITIHTSYIPFSEYSRLLNIRSVDTYIEYGGTLKKENMSFDDHDYMLEDVSFRDDESTRKYIDSAISKNIQHTLKNDHYGEYFNQLRELYEHGELTNVINRIIENINHHFLLHVIEKKFKSHDFGSAKDLLLHDISSEVRYVLTEVNVNEMIERLKKIIEVKEKEHTKVTVTQDHIDKVKKYLIMLDLIVSSPNMYESGTNEEYYIFTQPGMRYSIAKALVYSLLKDDYFSTIPEINKQYIINKILFDVKGRMLEDIVLLEVNKTIKKTNQVFKLKFDEGGEIDMLIYNNENNTCSLYEVKHSDQVVSNQYKNLIDQEKTDKIEYKYGKIISKNIIYRGKTKIYEGINYINVEEFLLGLRK